ncbi:MAG: nucleotide exchange factor GrpE [Candidatus Woesearchaeota archaeon]
MKKKDTSEVQEETQKNTKEPKENNQKITEEQYTELLDTLKRLQAEFENYKKRQEKETLQIIKNANAELIKKILPVLDSFELAIKNTNGNTEEIIKFKKGLEMIYAQLFSILKEQGLRTIESEGKIFDPYKHEVLMIKEDNNFEDDTIIEELQKGYMLNDIVLRHTKVMIAKHNKESMEGNKDTENNFLNEKKEMKNEHHKE